MSAQSVEQTVRAEQPRIHVAKLHEPNGLTLTLRVETHKPCHLHWGLCKPGKKDWRVPPQASWPPHSSSTGGAVQSAFADDGEGGEALRIHLDAPVRWGALNFVLYFPEERRWLKDGKRDFVIPLDVRDQAPDNRTPAVRETLEARLLGEGWRVHSFDLGHSKTLAAAVQDGEQGARLVLACDLDRPVLLHWGLNGRHGEAWQAPPQRMCPPGSSPVGATAMQTPFRTEAGLAWIELAFPRDAVPDDARGICFVLHQPEQGRWYKSGGTDMRLPLWSPLRAAGVPPASPERMQRLSQEIVAAELGRSSWTLMHRFNLCYDLLQETQGDPEALVLLYAWLRYSAIRQLDWQRHYNTKPRELAHAQDRLTTRLSEWYRERPESHPWPRWMLTTLGPGGEGQRVRDEILNIMHRHKIKEVHGIFMEEWHQKLHNNTTPDDIDICEAYLAFLESDGDVDQFYGTLEARGVSRERLQSFERPIRTDPDFYASKKEGLIHDFRGFLRILKSVHTGTDLESAVTTARAWLDKGLVRRLAVFLVLRRRGASVLKRVEAAVAAREALRRALSLAHPGQALRDLLYLDLALEEALRVAIEQASLRRVGLRDLTSLVHAGLRSVCLSVDYPEFAVAAAELGTLLEGEEVGADWALRVKSVIDRAARAIGDWSNQVYALLQPKAESLGVALQVQEWTIPLFSEEAIRGSPAFVLSLLLHRLDPILRERAGLGGWQVISPGTAGGRVRVVESLLAVQGESYDEPTVLVTDRVSGDEEIPNGVTSIITSDTPDLVSHVAVRARNAHVLFASCFEAETYDQFKRQGERYLRLRVTPAGDVEFDASARPAVDSTGVAPGAPLRLRRRGFSAWAIGSAEFDPERTGGKSNNLNALRGRLPEWIHFPASMALPFGVFEECLRSPENRGVAAEYAERLGKLGEDPPTRLRQLRELLLGLHPPEALQQALVSAWQGAGLPEIEPERVWPAVRRVWASKWNERAYYSRTARGVPHEDLVLAVLIQQVVEADYAFVIHTVDPMTGASGGLFAEVVLGLGETLVGNYPGRALGFLCRKQDLELTLLSYPSKSLGLYGRGVIFRSDSNGEDLEGFAGAGLYDSVLAEEPERRRLDYSHEPLVHDPAFRTALLQRIARLGLEVERCCGSPQDIEGAVHDGELFVVQTRPQVGL